MRVFQEITPVTASDVFIILDSANSAFDYPIHNHPEFELNLVLGCSGTRIIGDSTEMYQQQDLVLIGPYLFHKWSAEDQVNSTKKEDSRVITIQFDMHLFDTPMLGKKPFSRIKHLLQNASRGIQFTGDTLQRAKKIIISMTQSKDLDSVIQFLRLWEVLSNCKAPRYLASVGFEGTLIQANSKRLHATYQYILRHFKNPHLRMGEVSANICLSDSAFSHFFKKYTNRSFSEFLIDMRLGHAGKLLIDSDDLIADISFESGFNNLANFNRSFKKKHRCSPKIFRQKYQLANAFDWTNQITPGQFRPFTSENKTAFKLSRYTARLDHH